MEPVVITCGGCAARIRIRRPEIGRERRCPGCGTVLPDLQGSPAPAPSALPEPAGSPGSAAVGEFDPAVRRRLRVVMVTTLAILLSANAFWQAFGPPSELRDSRSGGLVLPGTRIALGADARRSPAGPRREGGLALRSMEADLLRETLPPTIVQASLIPFSVGAPAIASGRDTSSPTTPLPSPEDLLAMADPAPPRVEASAAGPKVPPSSPAPAVDAPPAPSAASEAPRPEPRRIRVRMRDGRTVVARVHGGEGNKTHVMLPDGHLGIPETLAYTEEPFKPATQDEMVAELTSGPFKDFAVERTKHYILLYQSSPEFARASGEVLEKLYKGLMEAFRKRDFPVSEVEFPLVAVIFKTERDLRAHKAVDKDVQAYYEIYTNRIYFYETSERDAQAPEVAAFSRPQTVAHEGTHQILQNIGIQPRLAPWPPWLIEGLAEYCATPQTTRKGTTWNGLGIPNAKHLATIRDLGDPLSAQLPGASKPEHIGRPPGMPLVEYLVKKSDLTPTDYALARAMTHYLATKRAPAFVEFLKTMSKLPPLEERSPDDQLALFVEAFGEKLVKLDKEINTHLGKLKPGNVLPYYAVLFQQRIPGGAMKRAAMVSQSPSMIQQWLEAVTSPRGEPPYWEPIGHPNRTRAWVTAEQWMRGF